jgi:head-tail adaptor
VILDRLVTLQSKTTTYDAEGMPVDAWTSITIKANIQSNNKSQVYVKEYALSDASYEFIIFTEVNSNISVGKRIIDGADSYDIMRIVKWPNHYELICSPTQG